jgi:predicted RND superfamily exporter protein
VTEQSAAMDRFAEWLVEHRRWVIGGVAVLSLVLGTFAFRLRLDFRYADLLPQDHPFIQVHNQFHRNFSEANVLTVMVEAREGTIFTAPILAKIYRLTDLVDRLPGVNHDQVSSVAHRMTRWSRVSSGCLISAEPIMSGPPETEEEARLIRRLTVQSYAFGSMVSVDERAAVIRAGFREDRVDYGELFAAVEETIMPLADENVAIYVSGQPRLNGWILRLEGQVLAAFAAAVVLTWVCLYAYFRDWRGALRPTISGGLAALWGFGLMRLTGFALNPLTLVIPFLITARAVSHSSQMHDRYYEELERGRTKEQAVRGSFTGLFAPTTAGILTDALGVLAIGLVAIPALRSLALAATVWLLSLIVAELLLNPIIYSYLRAPSPETVRRREHSRLTRACERLSVMLTGVRGRWAALGVGAGLFVASIALLPFVQVGDPSSASRMLASASEYNRSHRAVQERFGGNEPFMVVVEGDGPRALIDADVLHTIESFQRHMERSPVVGASFSLVDIVKSMGQLFHELEPKWGVIPNTEKEIAGMFFTYWGSVFPSTAAQFFTPDFRTAHITFFCRDHTLAHVRHVVDTAREFIAAHPLERVQFRLAGGFIGVTAAIYDEIVRSEVLMTAATFSVILLIAIATYRSVTVALLLVVPLVLANAVVNGYMAARGVGLDLNTLPVVAVGVGFGIDYGIYILSRIREKAAAGMSLEDAVHNAIARTGRTVAFTALTMTAGVLCFAFTELRFVSEMAMLLALWMLTSSAAALVLLPALVLVFRPRALLPAAGHVG